MALITASYSRPFAATQYEHPRSVSISATRDQSGDGSIHHAATSYVMARLGPFSDTTALSIAGQNKSMQSTFTVGYGMTGAAFVRNGYGLIGSGSLFDGKGLAVNNRSRDPQTAIVNGATVQVPARTSVLIPLSSGYIHGVGVSPGPTLSEQEAKSGQYLYKGNIKPVIIAGGFWVMARFESPEGHALPVQFTRKRPGEKLERLYLDSRQRAMLFELRKDGPDIERYVTTEADQDTPAQEYRCAVTQSRGPRDDHRVSTYQELIYTCVQVVDAGLKTARRR
ncbi:hypothetical protein EBB59_01495 [Lysobacter pythonis]|uniref:Uncharacterized protein n=1 Tax=Solilutibacter pythonis TaxID=2483112 RepID=A0A3M2HZG1_9GAMM|nr:hypothetical protein [Lysobacter pythonis]RMH94398.1 hypothetical protein EBB59_01495 [Lysobacter pythonis]